MPRFRIIRTTVGLIALLMAAIFTTDQFGRMEVRRLTTKVNDLEREKAEMAGYVRRISASRRVAQMDILSQEKDSENRTVTTLRWQQISTGGALGSPESITIQGEQIYVEAMVIKFDYDLVGRATPDHDASLVMFRRIFGDRQPPEAGIALDRTAPPESSGDTPPDTLAEKLWPRFWQITEDPQLASLYGIRVAQSEAPSVRVTPGQVWEVTLDAAGGLNLRLLGKKLPDATTSAQGTKEMQSK